MCDSKRPRCNSNSGGLNRDIFEDKEKKIYFQIITNYYENVIFEEKIW